MVALTETELDLVRSLLHQHVSGVRSWAYGSRVKGTARRTSDLDLVVFSEQGDGRVFSLREAFEESDLPFIVDVHVWNELPAEWQAEIELGKFELVSG